MPGNDPILSTALDALRNSPGLAFGDVHGDLSNPEWVRNNMHAMRAAGVTTFYTEMINREEQGLVEGFMRGDQLSTLELRRNIEGRWGGRNGGQGIAGAYFAMLEAARDSGMRVVGIDSPTLAIGADDRLQVANPSWAEFIADDQRSHPGKYLLYVGAGHTARSAFLQDRVQGNGIEDKAIPTGVDALLGIPSIDFNAYSLRRDVTLPAPTETSISPGAPGSSFVASTPASENQRRSNEPAVPQYSLSPDIERQIATLKGLNYQPENVSSHGAPATTPAVPPASPSVGRQ